MSIMPCCVLCGQGHVVLTDFGLCKEGVEPEGTTSTFCGTPEVSTKQIYTVIMNIGKLNHKSNQVTAIVWKTF